MEIELLNNPTDVKLRYDQKEDRTIIAYDSDQTKHDGCIYSVMGEHAIEALTGNVLKLIEVVNLDEV